MSKRSRNFFEAYEEFEKMEQQNNNTNTQKKRKIDINKTPEPLIHDPILSPNKQLNITQPKKTTRTISGILNDISTKPKSPHKTKQKPQTMKQNTIQLFSNKNVNIFY